MKKLAICIPNYNRLPKLSRLLLALAEQTTAGKLFDEVEICVNDDCSTESPQPAIEAVKEKYPDVAIKYRQNHQNMGMDYNFLNAVLLSEAEYCCIIGNDDLPEPWALKRIIGYLEDDARDCDFFVSPFDTYNENDQRINSVYPIRDAGEEVLYFDTTNKKEYTELINRAVDGNALFCFLSNVVFKRAAWVEHGDMFTDKMHSIFIQMYMNLQTLKEGAVYAYIPEKLVKNYDDSGTNETFKREYDVFVGLSGVIDYFFEGEEHRILQKKIVDTRLNGRLWELPNDSPLKQPILNIKSDKNNLYKKYFIMPEERKDYFRHQNVLVYGAGNHGRRTVKELKEYAVNYLAVFDADSQKQGNSIEGCVIKPAEDLYEEYKRRASVVVVANQRYLEEIVNMLRDKQVENIAIIT